MTSIAFTGTRHGMTIDQWATADEIIRERFLAPGPHEFHDGDCVGADTQIHTAIDVFRLLKELEVVMHGHPCNLTQWRAWNTYDIEHEVKPPLVRNRDMVDVADLVVAGPREYEEVLKGSGTWATIRYAKRNKKELIIVWPDGKWDFDYE